jgi:hypothetical protein
MANTSKRRRGQLDREARKAKRSGSKSWQRYDADRWLEKFRALPKARRASVLAAFAKAALTDDRGSAGEVTGEVG